MKNSIGFLWQLISLFYHDCNFFLVNLNFTQTYSSRYKWIETFESLAASDGLVKYSGGTFNIELKQNQTEFYKIQRPARMISSSCSVTLLLIPKRINEEIENVLIKRLEEPLKNPVTVKNRDKYFIFTEKDILQSISNSEFISSLKDKLILTEDENIENMNVFYSHLCSYCPLGRIQTHSVTPTEINSDITVYFPDFQKNYYGSVLRTSATDKLPGLMEMEKIGENKYRALRGVYAYALFHLIGKFNFTSVIFPSSGGGSTGHPLANGTWVGTVGDVYNGKADFGLVASITYLRFPVVELGAAITFVYTTFVTGPPERVFTWKAIFWPFSFDLWLGIICSIALSIIAGYFILHVNMKQIETSNHVDDKHWSIMAMIQYFGRTFFEQGDALPVTLPGSVRILLGFWLLFTLVSATAYKSKMVSFMTFPVLETLPENFEQLEKSNYKVVFHYFGNVGYNTFKRARNPTFVNIFNRMGKEPDPMKCLKDTITSKSACILFGITYEELRYRNLSNRFGDCPIRRSPNYAFYFTPGVTHKKKAALSHNFKKVIDSAMEMGLLSQWQKTDLNKILQNKNAWESENKIVNFVAAFNRDKDDVLHLPNLIGAFSILIVGIIMAVTSFVWERTSYSFRHSNWKVLFNFRKINRMFPS